MCTRTTDSLGNALRVSVLPNSVFHFSAYLNVDFLDKNYGNNMAFCQKMFTIFLNSIENDIEQLSSAVDSDDFQAIKDISHKIKNNFTWVGLSSLSEQVLAIENMAGTNTSLLENFVKFKFSFMISLEHIRSEYQRINEYLSNVKEV